MDIFTKTEINADKNRHRKTAPPVADEKEQTANIREEYKEGEIFLPLPLTGVISLLLSTADWSCANTADVMEIW